MFETIRKGSSKFSPPAHSGDVWASPNFIQSDFSLWSLT